MDFELTEEQQAVRDLAGQILADKLTHERLKDIEATDNRFAADEWRELARAGLIGIALPPDHGGAGLGIFEACLVLEQVGRTVAPVPYLATVVLGAMPIARFASPGTVATWLPGVIEGETVLSAALAEPGSPVVADPPATSAERVRDRWHLSGEKAFVPWAGQADALLVPARTGAEETAVFVVDAQDPGVQIEAITTTSGEPQGLVHLDGAVATETVGAVGAGDEVVRWMADRATAGVCATQAGVSLRAVEMIGTYTSEREQFQMPIATFQAVAQRAADAYIDALAVQFTAWLAAWRLSEGLPAADALDVAKHWAAEGGQRVAHAAQHLHGGIGVDRDYPLHRYFLWSKVLELTLGGSTERLRRLGARLAADPG